LFRLLATDGAARCGRLVTPHGAVETPVFMPVGTRGAVKSLSPDDLRAAGAQIVLGNTYHLLLRPGHELIRELGGLHRFMGWDGALLTDSGGFQVWSLAKLRKISPDGVAFRSPVDGATHFLSPERAIEVQHALGADVIHPLDECLDEPEPLAGDPDQGDGGDDRDERPAEEIRERAAPPRHRGAGIGHRHPERADGLADRLRRHAGRVVGDDGPAGAHRGPHFGDPVETLKRALDLLRLVGAVQLGDRQLEGLSHRRVLLGLLAALRRLG